MKPNHSMSQPGRTSHVWSRRTTAFGVDVGALGTTGRKPAKANLQLRSARQKNASFGKAGRILRLSLRARTASAGANLDRRRSFHESIISVPIWRPIRSCLIGGSPAFFLVRGIAATAWRRSHWQVPSSKSGSWAAGASKRSRKTPRAERLHPHSFSTVPCPCSNDTASSDHGRSGSTSGWLRGPSSDRFHQHPRELFS